MSTTETSKKTKQFKCLGSISSDKYKIRIVITARIQYKNKCLHGLSKLLVSQSLSIDLKIKLYITIIRPILHMKLNHDL